MKKNKIKIKCVHIFREWCMNCDDWKLEGWYCRHHQRSVKRCVVCMRFLSEDN
jgi:hypothetical protein